MNHNLTYHYFFNILDTSFLRHFGSSKLLPSLAGACKISWVQKSVKNGSVLKIHCTFIMVLGSIVVVKTMKVKNKDTFVHKNEMCSFNYLHQP